MTYLIKATDTSGILSLHRDTELSATKKAAELVRDGCWDVSIVDHKGQAITANDAVAARTSASAS